MALKLFLSLKPTPSLEDKMTGLEKQQFQKYLRIYKKNPRSQVFVLLADLYRKRGEREKALSLCQKGLEIHPQLSSGYIAQALILLDMDKNKRASEALEKATQLSPENILAHKLLGQTYLRLKNPLKTLSAYKMLLFLDPTNKTAQKMVQKLELITASQYDSTGFAFKSLKEVARHIHQHKETKTASLYPLEPEKSPEFSSRIAIIKALIYRKDFEKARHFIMEMKNLYPKQGKRELQKLEKLLPASALSEGTAKEQKKSSQTGHRKKRQKKIQKLKHWLSTLEKQAD